eukprot:1752401-Rhodomonas_salina.2
MMLMHEDTGAEHQAPDTRNPDSDLALLCLAWADLNPTSDACPPPSEHQRSRQRKPEAHHDPAKPQAVSNRSESPDTQSASPMIAMLRVGLHDAAAHSQARKGPQ